MNQGYSYGEPLRNRRPPTAHTSSSPAATPRPGDGSPSRKAKSWCSLVCKVLLVIPVLASVAIVFFALRLGYNMLHATNHAHSDITFDHKKHPAGRAKPMLVEPLINASTPFDIVATVWLDVTQHLEQGHTLPPGTETVTYLLSNTTVQKPRTEAILYQDTIFRNATMDTSGFASLPLDVPFEPLYTQILGPASLRVTFTLRPDEQTVADLGELERIATVFPESDLTLPRSVPKGTSLVLQDVLDHTAPSVPLLQLLQSQYYLEGNLPGFNCTGNDSSTSPPRHMLGNLPPFVPTFLDNSYPNRHFVKQLTHDQDGNRYYLGDSKLCQIWIPHVRSRVDVVLLRDERQFPLLDWNLRQQRAIRESAPCWEAGLEKEKLPPACYSIRKNGPLEQLLHFKAKPENAQDPDSVSVAFRWSPVLFDGGSASTGPAYWKRLPHLRPASTAALAQTPAIHDACHNSVLSPEDTKPEFFHIDVTVHFSAHKMMRSFMASSDMYMSLEPIVTNATTAWNVEEGRHKEMISNFLPEAQFTWALYTHVVLGRSAHPGSQPLVSFAFGVILGLIGLCYSPLTLLYWYTRSNTIGMSHNAQWMMASATVLFLPAQMRTWLSDDLGSRSFFDHVYYMTTIILSLLEVSWRVRTLLRLKPVARRSPLHGRRPLALMNTKVIQRPESKDEHRSRMAEKEYLRRWPMAIFAITYLCSPLGDRHILSGRGCYLSPSQPNSAHWLFKHLFSTLPYTLIVSASLTQLAFNLVSPRLAIDASHGTKASESIRGNFVGTLKTSACLAFFEATMALLLPNYERLSGPLPSKSPLLVKDAWLWLDSALFFAQALALPSVKQTPAYTEGEEQGEGDEIHHNQNGSYELLS